MLFQHQFDKIQIISHENEYETVPGKEFAFHHKLSNFLAEIVFLYRPKKRTKEISKRKYHKEAERETEKKRQGGSH
jgi:hypothetical protein